MYIWNVLFWNEVCEVFVIYQLNKMEQAASNKVMKLDLRRYHTGSHFS